MEKFEEVNYKKDFCEKYFDKDTWDLDVLNQVDVLLKDKKGNILLYIEAKYLIQNESVHRQALAQVILTNKKQESVLSYVALIYQDYQKNDVLEYIDCSDNSIMYNNDINWKAEKPSSPTKDAIDRINDRIRGKIVVYQNEEIREFYKLLKNSKDTIINITENNFNVVYNQWKNNIKFVEENIDEQDLINMYLVDLLNGTKYKKSIFADIEENTLFGKIKIGTKEYDSEQDLIREGTNLSHYKLMFDGDKIDGIKYSGRTSSAYYTISDSEQYTLFWQKYKRPPQKNEFLKILERSSTLYSEQYRRDTGGEYTPSCFVEKQVQILSANYNMDNFIVFDPCAGVGNLENQFGKDFKQYCFLSTLEKMDVDICKIKGFENAIQFDFLKNKDYPKFKYKGELCDIQDIAKLEQRKLMIIMNPPYQNKRGKKNNLAMEFFNKCVDMQPDVIVFYYMTESFLRPEINNYIKSGYKIVSHIFSNAKTTFMLKEWPISQIIFDKFNGEVINSKSIKADRYEFEKKSFVYKKTYVYDNDSPNLINEIDKKIKANEYGLFLGNYSYMMAGYSINLTNKTMQDVNCITSKNIRYCLLSKGINFNTHNHYFERNQYVYKGNFEQIPEELQNDSIMMALFYKNCAFTNREHKNYIMPFLAEELECEKNDLNVLFPSQADKTLFSKDTEELKPFNFREFMSELNFSLEAKDLYFAALEIFKFYHKSSGYSSINYNDSYYDIANAIMGKDTSSYKSVENKNEKRIVKTKTTKGTKGFAKHTIQYAVNAQNLPIFDTFFNKRDILAKKINTQLLDNHLLLWQRENIY